MLAPWLVHTRKDGHTFDFLPRDVVTPGRYVPLRVNGVKHESAKVYTVAVALIGLAGIVQSLDKPKRLDGMFQGDTRAPRSLQFVALDPQPDRAIRLLTEKIGFPVHPLL